MRPRRFALISDTMPAPDRLQNLALIGFMGTGKSVIGRKLSQRLGYSFVDTDQRIESDAGMPITQIFETQGEPAFRSMESKLVGELQEIHSTVIATGGGLVTHGDNLARLKEYAVVVCLCASPDEIWKRVRRNQRRPLLQRPDAREFIAQRLQERLPFYRKADLLVTTEGRSANVVADIILGQFERLRQAPPNRGPSESEKAKLPESPCDSQ